MIDGIFLILRTVLSLAAVLALIYLVLGKGGRWLRPPGRFVQVIEKTPLSNHAYLAVVKIGESYYVLSVNQGKSEILKELDPEAAEKLVEEKQQAVQNSPLNKLKQMRKNRE
ncbi:MAG TPA: flagellar biosynthesis protein FliZ [Eubacteriaceae bacterium]|nr:flagellar biosynthesis protein FliZ [Eubacteriaceae bacterium]